MPSGHILITSLLENCADCIKAQTKESLKRKRDNFIFPATSNATSNVPLTSPEQSCEHCVVKVVLSAYGLKLSPCLLLQVIA